LGLFFLGLALKGLLTRKPFLWSNRWYWTLIGIAFYPPMLIMGLNSYGVLMKGTIWALLLLILWGIWKLSRNNFVIAGILDKSFRKTLRESLGQIKLKYTEDRTGIHIKSSNLTLKTSLFMGGGQIQTRGKGAPDLAKRLTPVLKKELAKKGVKFDIKPFLFYLAFGLIILLGAFLMAFSK